MSETLPDLPDVCFPVDWSGVPDHETLDPEVKDQAAALAVASLRALTAGQVGGCPVTVKPRRTYSMGTYVVSTVGRPAHWFPHIRGGTWVNNVPCGGSCPSAGAVALPPPVGGVTRVTVGGVDIPPTAYRVEGTALVRTDGGSWPVCDPTFQVTYYNTLRVDGLAAYVAGLLAGEFAKARTTGKCRLPAGVTSVVRAGVSFQVPSGAFENGQTGIREIDTWVQSINPHRLTAAPMVMSPDVSWSA